MSRKPQKTAILVSGFGREFTPSECHSVAKNGGNPGFLESSECYLVAQENKRGTLDGNLARRALLETGIYWDDELRGFGLRVREGGSRSWIVKLNERGKARWVTLGRAEKLDATTARDKARALLTDAALDGLPRKPRKRAVPLFRDYAPEFWRDYAHHWKASTQTSNRSILRRRLLPEFGDLGVEQIRPTNIDGPSFSWTRV